MLTGELQVEQSSTEGSVCYLLQVDGSDLEAEDDDPQQTQDQRTVPVHHILWTNQIHPNLTETH